MQRTLSTPVNLTQTIESVTLTVATDLADVLAIEPEWNELWRRGKNTTPFQSAAWLLPYLLAFKPRSLKVLLIRRGKRLLAVIPLTIVQSEGQAVLRLLGQEVSDYLDGLCAEEERTAVCHLIEEWLIDELAGCDFAEFAQLQPRALLNSMPTPTSLKEEVRAGIPCPQVRLRERHTDRTLPLNKSMRQKVEASCQQLRRMGRLDLRLADHRTLDAAISQLFVLHTKRWGRRGAPGIFVDLDAQVFYREAFQKLEMGSALRLFTLYLNEAPIASLAAFCKDRTLYYYIGAFDPDYAKFSPGNIIISDAMEFAMREGYETFDFLRGGEPYKYKWGAQNQATYIRKLWRPISSTPK